MKDKLKNKNKKNKGFMLIEMVIAISIITMMVLSGTIVAQKSIVVSRNAIHSIQAVYLLEEGAEIIKMIRNDNWNNITSLVNGMEYYFVFSNGNWILSSDPSTIGIFTRKVIISNVNRDIATDDIVVGNGENDNQTKLITINASWIEGGQIINKNLSFYISDIFS